MPDAPAAAQVTRRAALMLLVGAALAVVSGCRATRHRGAGPATGTGTATATGTGTATGAATGAATVQTPPTPAAGAAEAATRAVVQRVAADERALLAAYDAAVAAHPDFAPLLSPLRDDHAQHLVALLPDASTKAAPTPTTASPSSTPTPAAAASSAPTAPTGTATGSPVADLIGLERAAAAARVNDLSVGPASLARLLASIGGCEAAHASLLAAK